MTYPPAYPHDPIVEIAPEIFLVRGSIALNRFLRITRNMVIIRHKKELTLVNPIRLDGPTESQLRTMGAIKNIMRTGPMHGLDDPYYVDTFKATFWCQKGGTTYPEPKIDKELSEDGPLPFPNAELFCFRTAVQPESALLFKTGKGLLVTCDAIQHYGDYKHNNLPARLLMPFIGFPMTTIIGPVWIKIMTPEGRSLKPEFERLLALDFDALISAHGSFLKSGAKPAVQSALDKVYMAGQVHKPANPVIL